MMVFMEGATLQTYLVMALQIASGVLYTVVGVRAGHRRVSQEAMLAVNLFQFWWYGLAALSFISPALLVGVAAFGQLPIPLWVALVDILLGMLCLAFLGLVYYLVYLYTGKRGWLWPLAIFYGVLFFGILALIAYMNPQGYIGSGVNAKPQYEHDITGSPAAAVFGLALIVPPLAAAIAYSLLFFRVHDPTARYRISLVSGSFILWFGSSLAAQLLNVTAASNPAWQLASMTISLLAAATVLIAYLPPKWLQTRLGVESITAERAG